MRGQTCFEGSANGNQLNGLYARHMAAKIKVIRGRDFLQRTGVNAFDVDESKRMLLELASESASPPDYNILLDFRRSQWCLSTAEIYDLAQELTSTGEHQCDRIAVLVLPGADFEKAEFLELCTKNRGIVNIDCFTNFEDAVQWFYESNDA